jgi:hypothetical protein
VKIDDFGYAFLVVGGLLPLPRAARMIMWITIPTGIMLVRIFHC